MKSFISYQFTVSDRNTAQNYLPPSSTGNLIMTFFSACKAWLYCFRGLSHFSPLAPIIPSPSNFFSKLEAFFSGMLCLC
jgi:hypothetical protein